MKLSESFNSIKAACDFQSLSPGACAITFKEGHAFARNLTLMAMVPFPGVKDCVVAAKEFQTAVRTFPDVETARVTARQLIISKGDSEGTITRMDPDVVVDYDAEPIPMRPIPEGFGEAIRKVAPFVSKDRTRTWTMGARIDGKSIVATNNIVLVEAAMDEDSGVSALTLSNSVVDFIVANSHLLKTWGITNKEIRFGFSNEGWVRATRLTAEMPDRVPQMLAAFDMPGKDAEVLDSWRDTITDSLAFADGLITVTSKKISGQRDGLLLECNVKTAIADPLVFGREFLDVLRNIDAINFYGKSSIPFRGKNFRGIMAARSIV